jgi:CRISPR/Cas system-associated exonuclease Cas4 (RecB family)
MIAIFGMTALNQVMLVDRTKLCGYGLAINSQNEIDLVCALLCGIKKAPQASIKSTLELAF